MFWDGTTAHVSRLGLGMGVADCVGVNARGS
jgi:hypothetical protein